MARRRGIGETAVVAVLVTERLRPGLALILLAMAQHPLAAQAAIVVPSTPVCAPCRIALGDEQRLLTEPDEALSRAPIWMAGDALGHVYIVEEVHEGGPLVVDRAGRAVARVGRTGGGPGEYRLVLGAHVVRGDSLWVFDGRTSRRGLHAPAPTWSFVTQERGLTHWASLAVRPDGGFAASAPLAAAPGRLALIHLFDRSGQRSHSFDEAAADAPERAATSLERTLAWSPGGLLAAHRLEYRIDVWSTSGSLVRELRRDPAWFPPRAYDPSVRPDRAPQPTVRAMRVDREGLLWVLVTRAGREWERGVGTPSVRMGDVVGWTALDRVPQLLYETVIEVLDPVAGRLIASTTIPGLYQWFVGDDRVGGYRTDADQAPIPVVRRVRLVGSR